MTCSEHFVNYYDVERFAGRTRGGAPDNNNQIPKPINVGIKEYLESTLPYERAITSAIELESPDGLAPFVADQSYLVASATGDREHNRRTPPQQWVKPIKGLFRPSPTAGDPDGFNKVADEPDPKEKSAQGSGGSFLSNEIFYRTALLRDSVRPALASGHFHIPSTGNDPQNTGLRLITRVKEALGRLVDNLPAQARIISFNPAAGRPGAWVTIRGEGFDGATDVRIGGASVPFRVTDAAEITADVTDDADTGYIEVETPQGTAVSSIIFRVVRRFPREILSENLRTRRLELGLTQKAAAQQMGVKPGTYANWEQGRDEPRVSSFPTIINFLGYDPSPEAQTLSERIREVR